MRAFMGVNLPLIDAAGKQCGEGAEGGKWEDVGHEDVFDGVVGA